MKAWNCQSSASSLSALQHARAWWRHQSRELEELGSEWTTQLRSWFWVSDIAVGWVPTSPQGHLRLPALFVVIGLLQRLASPQNAKEEAVRASRMGTVYFHYFLMGKACHSMNLDSGAEGCPGRGCEKGNSLVILMKLPQKLKTKH